jgi:uncharacterized damage-inducible protein DinB
MEKISQPEVWQRGPIDGVPGLLQPVAHALLQTVEDIEREMKSFPSALLWDKPEGVASIGFHLKHVRGVVDRLFTYARGKMLNEEQMRLLKGESTVSETDTIELLLNGFRAEVQRAIQQLKNTDTDMLTEQRGVGRKQIPSTVIGLLFHAAEHVQRHVGQLIVTARILKSKAG